MAKVQLRAGAELDLLSAGEYGKKQDEMKEFFAQILGGEDADTVTKTGANFTTDGTGGTANLPQGGHSVYRVPVGYDAFLTRLAVDYEGSSAAAPATCDLRIVADQNTPSGLKSITNQVPNVFAEGRSHCPLFRGGQEVVVCMLAGPANTQMYVGVQVVLVKRKPIKHDTLEG